MTSLDDLLAAHAGLLVRRDLTPRQRSAVERGVAAGALETVFPGVYVSSAAAAGRELRARALTARFPTAVLCGATAAQFTFWPELADDVVHACCVRARHRAEGFDLSRRTVDPIWVRPFAGVRLTAPALTAIELADATRGGSIDRALRSRRVTLAGMHEALNAHPHRAGNLDRRRLLLDSRDEPWSTAERLTHRLLRDGGVRGWRGNWPVRVHDRTYFLDVAFPLARVCVEIDGQAFHSDPTSYETDRARQNDLVLAGWLVLRFTWRMLQTDPAGVLTRIRRSLDARRQANRCR